ncbi:DUF4340 domain-containing protein [Pontiella sp.]|uniref:DUF4340 domain-containing protein n=1 Tax=Pontiella sp. TaxID=2837462 RepID=UPI00356509ED
MKGRSTLVLFISIVVLGIFIWGQETWRARKPARDAERVRLFNLDGGSLLSIAFTHSNGTVRCVNDNGVWMAGNNDDGMGRADEALIQRLVSGLNSMGKGTTITEKELSIRGINPEDYGFDEPMAVIEAVDNHGRQRWLVGRRAPLGNMVYAKKSDEENIYTISDKLIAVIPGTADILRDRIVFPGDSVGVRRMEIRGGSGFIQLLKDPKEGWRIQQPVAAPADAKEVDLFLNQLYRLRIEEFVLDNVSDFSVYGLQGETMQISVGQGDGNSRMLIVGSEVPDKPGQVYARRADDTSVFSISSAIRGLLNVPAGQFRDASLLSVPPGSISRISLTRGEDQLSMEYDGTNSWSITRPVVWTAEPRAVSDMVTFWVSAVITEFDLEAPGTDPEWILEFYSAQYGTSNRLEIFPTRGSKEGLLIRRDGDAKVCRINLPYVPESFIDPLNFKGRNIWMLDTEQVKRVELIKPQKRQVVERLEDNRFAPVEPSGDVNLNREALTRLLRNLQQVNTSGYITYNPRDLDIYGLADPSIELHLGLSGTNELGRVLLVGRETSEGYYSMVKGRDVIFFLDKPAVLSLTADFIQPVPVAEPVPSD